jgi:hypothetical protein
MVLLYMIDVPHYDQFDLKHYEEKPMSLHEAADKAAQMRKSHPGSFYRVVPATPDGELYHVDIISKTAAQAELRSKLITRWLRMAARRLPR